MYTLTVQTHKWMHVHAKHKRKNKRRERRRGGITVYPGVLKMQYGPPPVYGSVGEDDSGGV